MIGRIQTVFMVFQMNGIGEQESFVFCCGVADILDNHNFQGAFVRRPVALSDGTEDPSMVTFCVMARSRFRVPFALRTFSGCNLASVTQKWRPTSSVAALLGLGAFRGHNLCLTY